MRVSIFWPRWEHPQARHGDIRRAPSSNAIDADATGVAFVRE
ncbi:hypothetical protein L195_g041672 [Trifolium pratense]|uniref:Uncharacterized protein n=1 Tax=Trifolium pratense TaxID=57577 RepID=A0A2K3M486_TRIPR|nr:hypothetical protein L195_g041672 [Trifolium pratense]